MHRWDASQVPDQSGRTALVTGANSGLGLQTSLQLARAGARVLMACRDPSRAQTALDAVRRQVPQASVEVVPLDLASLASVRAAAADVATRTERLDLLVDNAGVMAVPRQVTPDGFELQLATNHLGHFALTGLVLPLLLAAPAPRVVVVSSTAHRFGAIRFDDLQGERGYSRWGSYGQSKLANLLFARELDRRSAATPLLVAAAHPGYAATHLQRGQGSFLLEAGMRLANLLVAQSDAAGALPSLYAATMPDVRRGDFWGPSLAEVRGAPKRVGRAPAASDDAAARRLWDVSEQLTGVVPDLPVPALP